MTSPDLEAIASEAESEMRASGIAERAVHEKAYLKSTLDHAGAPLPAIRAVARRIRREYADFDTSTVFALGQRSCGRSRCTSGGCWRS